MWRMDRHMKNKIIAIALAILALSSCQKAFNVSSVRFSKEGGTQTIEVVTYEGVSINDGNANYGKSEYDETTGLTKTTLDWLSVEYNKATNECTVIATKNDSGKKRTFFREAMYGDLLINWNTRNSRQVNSLFIGLIT